MSPSKSDITSRIKKDINKYDFFQCLCVLGNMNEMNMMLRHIPRPDIPT